MTWNQQNQSIVSESYTQRHLLTSSQSVIRDSQTIEHQNALGDLSQTPTLNGQHKLWSEEESDTHYAGTFSTHEMPPLRPNRRRENDEVELGGVGTLTATNLSWHNKNLTGGVNPAIHTYTSPISAFSTSKI